MSCSIIHNGHIRLLKKASRHGRVIVALTSDSEIKKYKKIEPELNFKQRKEIVSSIKYVDKVIPSKWKITNGFLKKNKIDIIIRGHDHKKDKFQIKSIIFPRTKGVSSKLLRKKSAKIFKKT